MRFASLGFLATALTMVATAASATPRVVADIAPLHSIVARVMQGAGEPVLLLPPGASPHGHSLRPSDAKSLQSAEIVFWTGPALAPWLERMLPALAANADRVDLSALDGLTRLELRDGARFAPHEHHDDAHGHAHGDHEKETDPHLWLDPRNAALWAQQIAAGLAERDPENASLYTANAEAFASEISALESNLKQTLSPLSGRPFFVFHDAFHYFEARFGIEAAGAIAASDAAPPGPRRLREIRHAIEDAGTVCLFTEPQQSTKLIDAVAEGLGVRVATLDPVGATLEPGPELYPAVLNGLAKALAGCLADAR